MSSANGQAPDPEIPAKARTRKYSASYKARIVAEYEELDKSGKGALLPGGPVSVAGLGVA
ncbi:MAG TPA: hypothetical protein VJT49_18435 [Amycolatopsis sp.]|uniref:hypothetical protein n=1 Tax=Amycolatopsis sp. TaxID=37632 RepID=UPI002B48CAF4|nr:hypothetical protein [Amycolatopsis sp.]HKS47047.1 hypothetical protein [Amycolatopsis sp.]